MVVGLLALLALPANAAADIDVNVGVDRARVGELVTLAVGCGGCQTTEVELPVALVPAADPNSAHPCARTSCARRSPRPPRRAPYVPLGVARFATLSERALVRFAVPDVEPGRYAVVAYCRPCGNSIVGNPSKRYADNAAFPLRVLASPSGVANLVARAVADVVGDQAKAVDRSEGGGLEAAPDDVSGDVDARAD